MKTGRRVRQGCCLWPILYNVYSKYPTQEVIEGFGDFKIGGQVICTVKYADYLVLMSKEEVVLSQIQIMIDKNNWRMWITSTILEACRQMMQKVHKGI